MAKDTKHVGYKGPRVTTSVLKMDDAGRKTWLDNLKVSDTEREKIKDRLTKALANPAKGSKFNIDTFKTSAEKFDIATLVEIQKVVAPLILAGKDAEKAPVPFFH